MSNTNHPKGWDQFLEVFAQKDRGAHSTEGFKALRRTELVRSLTTEFLDAARNVDFAKETLKSQTAFNAFCEEMMGKKYGGNAFLENGKHLDAAERIVWGYLLKQTNRTQGIFDTSLRDFIENNGIDIPDKKTPKWLDTPEYTLYRTIDTEVRERIAKEISYKI